MSFIRYCRFDCHLVKLLRTFIVPGAAQLFYGIQTSKRDLSFNITWLFLSCWLYLDSVFLLSIHNYWTYVWYLINFKLFYIWTEIMNREMGLTFPCGKTAQDHAVFESRFYGSLHAVYRLKKLHNLNKHRGCVNSINFHPEGKNNDLKWRDKIMLVFSVAMESAFHWALF